MMKRVFAAFMALLLLPLFAFAEETAAVPETHTVEKRTYPHVYVYNTVDEPAEEEMNLYFMDGGIDPDVILTDPNSYYDRSVLAELIRNLK